ncbi:MAG TPA: hypothetical protein VND65_02540 [Candidatus Binatia bacterium]|nr:hypothetical protein [Candidatus Binatia bacterium]
MELLLNLAWLLLALPAYWVWRGSEAARTRRGASSLQCLFALGCALVLLFPVISASDDLHAMRAEMEDSSASKRAVRQAAAEKHGSWVDRWSGAAAIVTGSDWLHAPQVSPLQISRARTAFFSAPVLLRSGRAPPFSRLG